MSARCHPRPALAFALPFLPAPFRCAAPAPSPSCRRLFTSLSASMTTSSSSSSASSLSTLRDVLLALRAVVPPLDGRLSKGQCGLTGVLGGSDQTDFDDYTGAPLLVTLSSLRFGADQSYVCTPSAVAAASMKPYSPDVAVITGYQLPYVQSAVLGTGLGTRFDEKLPVTQAVEERECVTVLTPNTKELDYLRHRGDELCKCATLLSATASNVVVLEKGEVDVVSVAGETVARVGNEGAPRRCVGLGDVLAGVVNTALAWASGDRGAYEEKLDATSAAKVVAGGAALVREATRRAFVKQGRGMIATDVVSELPGVVRDFEHGTLIEDIVARTLT